MRAFIAKDYKPNGRESANSRLAPSPAQLRLARLGTTVAMIALMAAASADAHAQDAGAQDTSDSRANDTLMLEEIVVTGRPAGDAIRKLEASYAISTISADEIAKYAPKSTADMFKTVPGIWVESSGGEAGANIFVRGFPSGGDAPFVTVSVEGMPIYPASTLSFLENSSLFRIDETVERLESIRGGVNAVYNKGEVGATFNFLLKEGGPDYEGLFKASVTDFGGYRFDTVFSGPINENTTFMIGGFYRASPGVRDAQFNSERGGQVTAKVTHTLENGKFSIYARLTDDRVAWLLPIPVISDAKGNVREFPGFSIGHGNLIGNATRLARLEVGPGQFIDRSLDRGRGTNYFLLGGTGQYDFGPRWHVTERFNYMKGDAPTFGLVPAMTPRSAADFLAEVGGGTGGTFTYVDTGEAVPLDRQVMTAGWWSVQKNLQTFSNDLSIRRDIGDDQTLTFGAFFTDYSSKDLWYLGNNQLLSAEQNARRIDLVLDDGRQVTRDGFVGAPFFDVNASYNNTTIAGYLSYEWDVTDRLRIDGGARVENQKVDGTLENVDFGVDLDGDPTTLFNNNAAVLNGTFRTIDFKDTVIAGTVGANYMIGRDMGVFARFSRGHKVPQFDSMRDGNFTIQASNQYEAGFKANTDYVGVFSTFFFNDFTGLPFLQQLEGQAPRTVIGTSHALGVELELVVTPPIEGLSLHVQGTWQNAEFDKLQNPQGQDLSGNRVQRQPRWQFRVTPNWDREVPGLGHLTLYGSWTHVGKRFSDPENQQPLAAYDKIDLGAVLEFNGGFFLQVVADNLNNSNGLTEGNPRLLGSQGTGVIFARPILGRSFRFTGGYRF
ncbi:MAG: TonB-dependent receptor [Alphaproteobacteria bacterium]|nr:MAG: TonB-dependent receptor [Alphaproteobacteria bacterium]